MSLEPEDLLPELQRWNDGRGIDWYGYLSCTGSYELAVVFSDFFWPNFVEHDGCIFRSPVDVENYEQWKLETKGDKTAIEGLMNHVHILDLFPNVNQPPTLDQIVYLGRKIQELWLAKLHRDFPNKEVSVDFLEGSGDDPLGYQVTHYQLRTTSDAGCHC